MFSSVSLTFSFPPPLQSFHQPFFASSLAFVFSSLFSSHNYLSPPRLSTSPLPSFPPSLLCLPFFSSTISSIYLSFIYILTFLYLPFLSEPSSLMFSFIHHLFHHLLYLRLLLSHEIPNPTFPPHLLSVPQGERTDNRVLQTTSSSHPISICRASWNSKQTKHLANVLTTVKSKTRRTPSYG